MTLIEHADWRLREATPDDNDVLCALAREVPMGGRLVVAQEREPDYFAALRLHDGPHVAHIVESNDGSDAAVGAASYTLRRTVDPDAPRWIGHVGDIRFRPGARRGRIFPMVARRGLEAARERHGAELFFTAIIDHNARAQRAIRPAHHAELPVIRPAMRYQMLAVQCVWGRHKPSGEVRQARPEDLPELARFLQEREKTRIFGQVLDGAALGRRFDTWPGLNIPSFLLRLDRSGGVVGCTAPWDASAVRRTRVEAYHGPLRGYRLLHDLVARGTGAAALPRPGDLFRYRYLTHLEAEGDDPVVYGDLIGHAWREARRDRLHFVAAMQPSGRPVLPRRRSWIVDRTDITLHAVTLPDSEWSDRSFDGRIAFEMALA